MKLTSRWKIHHFLVIEKNTIGVQSVSFFDFFQIIMYSLLQKNINRDLLKTIVEAGTIFNRLG
jgi:hypothetical protein